MKLSDKIRDAKKRHRALLRNREGVVGVGVGKKVSNGVDTGREAIVVFVKRKRPLSELSARAILPRMVDDVEVDVIEVGDLKALKGAHEEIHRPLVAGISVGHYRITAGTLGLIVVKNGQAYILSNNHVLSDENRARIGDPVLQPGPYDFGTIEDQVATLSDFIPIRFAGEENRLDCALALLGPAGEVGEPPAPPPAPEPPKVCPISKAVLSGANAMAAVGGSRVRFAAIPAKRVYQSKAIRFTDDILGLPVVPTGNLADAEVGEAIHKSGRTTGVTSGKVLAIDVDVTVEYDSGLAEFADQFMGGAMSAGGDSGSACFDNSGNVVGLLFAGSDTTTIFNPIMPVFSALGIQSVFREA